MTDQTTARILGAGDGEVLPLLAGVANRFMIDGADSGGRFALVQHLTAARALAAPVHRHHDEDEFTYVLTGRIGAMLGDEEAFGGPGDLIFKPRGQWHTFWNAGDEPATVLEVISPAGLEQLFCTYGTFTQPPAPETMVRLTADYRCDIDIEAHRPDRRAPPAQLLTRR